MNESLIEYVGWLGHGNLGDEALFIAICDIFKKFAFTPYDNYTFLFENRPLVFSKVQNHKSNVCIFGGGTLLPDDITWIKPCKYNYVFGSAVKDPSFSSKFSNSGKTTIDRLKRFNFRFVGVRDQQSKSLLADYGISSNVIGDPALFLESRPNITRNSSKIAINVGCDGLLWGGNQEIVVQEVARFCKILKENSYTPILVPFSRGDLATIKKIAVLAKTGIFPEWFELQAVIDFIASCKVLVGQRLHSIILSAATFTPFISLAYRPKCFHFSKSVQMLDHIIRTDSITAGQLFQLFNKVIADWHHTNIKLRNIVKIFRKQQRILADQIMADIQSLPTATKADITLKDKVNNELFWKTDLFLRKNAANVWSFYNRLIFLHIMKYLI